MRSWTLETISWTCSSVNFGVEVLGLGFAPGVRDGASLCACKVAGIRAKQTQSVSPTNWGGLNFIFAILLAVGRQRQFEFVLSCKAAYASCLRHAAGRKVTAESDYPRTVDLVHANSRVAATWQENRRDACSTLARNRRAR